ncbi:Triple functional domain protein [Manis javanica]|nr:Triple functional domain protein [Manis javanica]
MVCKMSICFFSVWMLNKLQRPFIAGSSALKCLDTCGYPIFLSPCQYSRNPKNVLHLVHVVLCVHQRATSMPTLL